MAPVLRSVRTVSSVDRCWQGQRQIHAALRLGDVDVKDARCGPHIRTISEPGVRLRQIELSDPIDDLNA